MPRLLKVIALFLAALWLPATLHCQLEAAEVEFLTHDHGHGEAHHDHDGESTDEHHAFKEPSVTLSKPLVKVLPPTDVQIQALVAFISLTRDNPTAVLSPERHPPPLAWAVAWQFIARAAPPARAPSLNS